MGGIGSFLYPFEFTNCKHLRLPKYTDCPKKEREEIDPRDKRVGKDSVSPRHVEYYSSPPHGALEERKKRCLSFSGVCHIGSVLPTRSLLSCQNASRRRLPFQTCAVLYYTRYRRQMEERTGSALIRLVKVRRELTVAASAACVIILVSAFQALI